MDHNRLRPRLFFKQPLRCELKQSPAERHRSCTFQAVEQRHSFRQCAL